MGGGGTEFHLLLTAKLSLHSASHLQQTSPPCSTWTGTAETQPSRACAHLGDRAMATSRTSANSGRTAADVPHLLHLRYYTTAAETTTTRRRRLPFNIPARATFHAPAFAQSLPRGGRPSTHIAVSLLSHHHRCWRRLPRYQRKVGL